MNFEEFKTAFINAVKRGLCEKRQEALEFHVSEAIEVNRKLSGFTARIVGCSLAPTIYVEDYFADFLHGLSFDETVSNAIDCFQRSLGTLSDEDVPNFEDYESLKTGLYMILISAEKNRELLETVPFIMLEDLAIVFKVKVNVSERDGAIMVNNSMLEQFKITLEQLHTDAVENCVSSRPLEIMHISEVLSRRIGIPVEELIPVEASLFPLFVATVPDGINGASVIAYPDFFEKCSNILGTDEDFYILPSSIHEVMITPKSHFDPADLLEIVRYINETEVLAEEKLTDNIYLYERSGKTFKKIF